MFFNTNNDEEDIIFLSYYSFEAPVGRRTIELVPMKIYEASSVPLMAASAVAASTATPVTAASAAATVANDATKTTTTTTTTMATATTGKSAAPVAPLTQQTTAPRECQLPPVEYYNIIDENIIPEDPKSNSENLKLIQQILEDLKVTILLKHFKISQK